MEFLNEIKQCIVSALPSGPIGLAPLQFVLSILCNNPGTQSPNTLYAFESDFLSSARVLTFGSLMIKLH